MQKIYCADLRCKYRDENTGLCKCKKITLSSWTVATKNMGYKDFWECKSFEHSEHYLELKQKMIDLGILEEITKELPND